MGQLGTTMSTGRRDIPESKLCAERVVELPWKEGEAGNSFTRRDERLPSEEMGRWAAEAGNACEGKKKSTVQRGIAFRNEGWTKQDSIVLQGGLVFVFASLAGQKSCRKGRC